MDKNIGTFQNISSKLDQNAQKYESLLSEIEFFKDKYKVVQDQCDRQYEQLNSQQQQINDLQQSISKLQNESQQQSNSNKSISLVQQQVNVNQSNLNQVKSSPSNVSIKDSLISKSIKETQKSLLESSVQSQSMQNKQSSSSIQKFVNSSQAHFQNSLQGQSKQYLNQQVLKQFQKGNKYTSAPSQSIYSMSQKAQSAPINNKTFTSSNHESNFKLDKYLQSTQARSVAPNLYINTNDVDIPNDVDAMLELPIEDPSRDNKFHKFDFKEKFNGDKSYTQIWISRFQLACVKYNLTHSQCLYQALALMQAQALQWFLTEKTSNPFTDFYDFKSRFIVEFSVTQDDARRELYITIKSKGETNEQYLKRLKDIAIPAILHDKDVKHVFLNQLDNSKIDPIFKQLILRDDQFRSDQILKYLQEHEKQVEYNQLLTQGIQTSSSKGGNKETQINSQKGKNPQAQQQQQNFQKGQNNSSQQNYKGRYKRLANRYLQYKFKNNKGMQNKNVQKPINNLEPVLEEKELSDNELDDLLNAIMNSDSDQDQNQTSQNDSQENTTQGQSPQEEQQQQNISVVEIVDNQDAVDYVQLEPEKEYDLNTINSYGNYGDNFDVLNVEKSSLEAELNNLQQQVRETENNFEQKRKMFEQKYKQKFDYKAKQKDNQGTSKTQNENYLSRYNLNTVYFIPNKNILIRSPEYYKSFMQQAIDLLKNPNNMLSTKENLQLAQNFMDSLEKTYKSKLEKEYFIGTLSIFDVMQHRQVVNQNRSNFSFPPIQSKQINSIQTDLLKDIPLENQLVAKDISPLQFAKVSINNKQAYGMVDTGAVVSVISQSLLESTNLQNFVQDCNVQVTLAVDNLKKENKQQQSIIITKFLPKFDIILNGQISVKTDLYVTFSSRWQLLLGRNFLDTIRFKLANNYLYFYVPSLRTYSKVLLKSQLQDLDQIKASNNNDCSQNQFYDRFSSDTFEQLTQISNSISENNDSFKDLFKSSTSEYYGQNQWKCYSHNNVRQIIQKLQKLKGQMRYVDINTLSLNNGQQTNLNNRVTLIDTLVSEQDRKVIDQIYKNLLINIEKQYNLLLVDCPWKFNNAKGSPFSKYAPKYNCLTFEQLKYLPIKYLAAKDSILLMWVVQSKEDEAEKLIKQWGFNNHKDFIIWGKTKNGKITGNDGTYSIVNTEKLWICTKGSVKRFLTDKKVRQLQITDVTSHSAKPTLILDKIKARFKLDQINCLELFARNRYLQEFDLYGDALKPNFQRATKPQNAQLNQFLINQNKNIAKYTHLRKLNLTQQEKANRINIICNAITDAHYKNKFLPLLQRYIQIFAFQKQEFGITDLVQHEIILNKDAQPFAKAPYKVSPNEEEFIQKELNLLLQLQCIEKSKSEWASPIVIVRKANGSLRLCIDYRALNKATKRDEYPLPRIDILLQKCARGKIFSRLDLKSGFWQILLREKDKYLTSFTCSQGTFQWNVMPFGLTNAPATFQRLMDEILKQFLNNFCCVYIDDIIIYSENLDQHLKHLQLIFQALENAGLRIGFDKCEFFKPSILMLGHEVQYLKYSPLKSRTDAITKMQPPIDKKGVMSFLGLVNYYGSFIQNLAFKAKPLRDLTRQNVHFQWTTIHQNAFDALKQEVAKETFLHIPEQGKVMTLYTDFSEHGVGAVLSQKVDDKNERVIEFASRVLKRHEYNYPAYKGELLAIHWAMQKFRYYLLQAPFRLIIDNLSAVQILEASKDSSKKSSSTLNSLQKSVLRWLMQIQEFQFTPIHRQGLKHNNADALSRLPLKSNSLDISCLTILQTQCYKENYPIDINNVGINYLTFTSNEDLACCICQKLKPEYNMIICECCGNNYHHDCHKPRVKFLPKGAWYCKSCLDEIDQMQIVDPTLDFELINYLKNGIIPEDFTQLEKDTLTFHASTYYIDEHERLIKLTPRGERTIPTIVERKMLLFEKHHINGHSSIEKFISLLSNEYYWPTMRKDVEKFCSQCDTCSLFNANFRQHPQLHPIEKGTRPCATWVIDLTSNMNDNSNAFNNTDETIQTRNKTKKVEQNQNVTIKENKFLIIAIDPFSKWVEIEALPNKNSETILSFFINNIMKRFGMPCTIRTDKGTEFLGSFHQFLEDSRVQHIQVSRAYPKANGQVERTIRTIKAAVKRYYNQPINQMQWDEALPIIQMTQNAITSQSTKYSPHEIIFGRPMNYVSSIVVQPPIYPHRDATDVEIQTYIKSIKQVLQQLHKKVVQNMQKADDRNKQYYDSQKRKEPFQFKTNDIVYVKLVRTNKYKLNSRGPYLFLKYLNNNLNAEIKELFGKQKSVVESTANLYLQRSQSEQEQDVEE